MSSFTLDYSNDSYDVINPVVTGVSDFGPSGSNRSRHSSLLLLSCPRTLSSARCRGREPVLRSLALFASHSSTGGDPSCAAPHRACAYARCRRLCNTASLTSWFRYCGECFVNQSVVIFSWVERAKYLKIIYFYRGNQYEYKTFIENKRCLEFRI